MAELLREGYKLLVLVRPGKHESARARIERLLAWFGMSDASPRVEVIEGHIEAPDLGLNNADMGRLLGVDEIIHCASNTSFSERKRLAVEAVNIQGLTHVLDLAAAGGCAYFHHLSTSYVAGRQSGLCREDVVPVDHFTNVYEETKYRGERIVVDRCGRAGIRANIYRPSIVYGDSKTGRSTRFNALYYPIRTVHFFKNLFERDISENGGKRALRMGVVKEDGASLHLPIRIRTKEGSGLNVVPVDYFTAAFAVIMHECIEGGVFHLVNPAMKSIGDLVDYTRRFFGLTGLECVNGRACGEGRNPLEILFDTYNEAYEPYMQDVRLFDDSHTAALLAPRGVTCPAFDFDMFSRCMTYAIENRWGADLESADVRGDP